MAADDEPDCDYVVVGSGAGGGAVAARLAEAGMQVVLLEAGGDPRQLTEPGLPEAYEVPVFHSLASVSYIQGPARSADAPATTR